MSFLKAQWRKLAIANYEINPALLSNFLPYGTELDLWQGRCYVSLVGFMFLNTRPHSESEFITEHYWGYAKVNQAKTNEYEVSHHRWNCYEVLSHAIEVDFEEVYGPAFSFLNKQEPASVMLAEGSAISVEIKKSLRKREKELVL